MSGFLNDAPVLLLLGFMFLIGLAADLIGRHTIVPRVTLLILGGLAIGPAGFDLLPHAFVQQWFPPLTTLALSLVGLAGMVLNSILHRTKELSIRKVLGASSKDNIKLLTWQYLKPVLIANIPAWAAAYYFLSNWLAQYPQRVDMGLWLYLAGGFSILIFTVGLVSLLVARTSRLPPAEVLKYE